MIPAARTPTAATGTELHRLPLPGSGGGVEHLAVRHQVPAAERDGGVSLVYLHGFGSSQEGEKAVFFRRWAAGEGFSFTSFDFRGHGESGGELGELTMSRNLVDARAVLAWLAERRTGPVVLFGSSMGGATAMWLTVPLEAAPASSVSGVIGLAPALAMDRALADRCGPEGLARWREAGRRRFENEVGSCELGWELMEDLAGHRPEWLAERYSTRTLILQGMRDESVAWRDVTAFAAAAGRADVELHLFAAGDHRLIAQRERIAALVGSWLTDLRG